MQKTASPKQFIEVVACVGVVTNLVPVWAGSEKPLSGAISLIVRLLPLFIASHLPH